MTRRPPVPFIAGAWVLSWLLVANPTLGADLKMHGLIDIVAAERGPAYDGNALMRGDSPFDAYGLRVFADAQASPRLQVYTQFVLRDATTPYVDGAYVLFTPWAARDLHVLAGKVPWAIGTYAPRTYSNRNPLIGAPLMYQYHSTLLWYEVVPNADVLLAAAGTGQSGVEYFGYPEGRGMTLVDDSYWDVGVTVTGSRRPLEYALGVTAGTPGWASTAQDENSGKTMLGRVGLAPLPGVRLGASGAYGPYLDQFLSPLLPPGHAVTEYHQALGMADLELEAGHIELRAEGAHNVWQTPNVGDLRVTSGYLELKYSLSIGAFAAGRWDAMRFGDIRDSAGARRPWDSNVTRVEVGGGYRFNRDAVAKVVVQRTRLETSAGAADHRDLSLLAAQLSVAF